MQSVLYSLVFPCKNEALSIPQLVEEIDKVMHGEKFEVIAVNDASCDKTKEILKKLSGVHLNLKTIHFTSHQGKWAALSAGLRQARGKIIITLDSDLQDDPAELPKLIEKLQQGYDIVSGWRKKRLDPTYKVIISKMGNKLVSIVGYGNFHDLNSSLKIYRREVLESLPVAGSILRFSFLFAKRLGYNVAEVEIRHRPRIFGRSKFGVLKYLRIIYDLVLVLLLFSGSNRLEGKNSLK